MRQKTGFAALLLAGAAFGTVPALADNTGFTKVANASGQASTEEIISVTAAAQDSQGGGTSGGSARTTDVGTIDVEGVGESVGNGYIVPEDGPKERSTVTHAGAQNSLPSSNPFQLISLLPGVNQFQDDATGLSGGTIRVRGLVAAQMGFTVNGAPYNDSNSFAIFPQEIIDAEDVGQIWVSQGSTDVDAPHVGASGGNIGIVTRAPLDTFNVEAEGAKGALDYFREYAALDTGWIGPFKGFASYSHTEADKWRGAGSDTRNHSDGNFLWQISQRASLGLTWAYNDGFNDSYRSYSSSIITGDTALQAINATGGNLDFDTFWGSTGFPINLVNPATVANPFFAKVRPSSVTNAFGLNLNPFRNVIATAPLHIQVNDNLRWDTNFYLWWGEGNGGFGSTLTVGGITDGYTVPSEYNAVAGNRIVVDEESVNKTFRPGFTTKFEYDVENYTFVVGGWLEHSRQTNTEPVSLVNSNATPCDPWMVELGNNRCAVLANSAFGIGTPLEIFDDRVNSIGQSVFGQAQGRFLNDALKVYVGLSYRDVNRSVHNQQPVCVDDPALVNIPGSANTCLSVATTTAFTNSSAYRFFGGDPTQTGNAAQDQAIYQRMQRFAQNPHVNFGRLLPEFDATYDFDPYNQVFAGISSGFRSPNTLNFESFNSAGTVMNITDIKSEVDWSYEAGYRFHGSDITASVNGYLHDISNYQASAQIDPVDFITTNIGGVKIYGVDGEIGTAPWHGLTLYLSGTLQNSSLGSDVPAETCTGQSFICFVHTKGKRLVDTPNWIVSTSIGYEQDGFFANIEPHCQGDRPTSLLNDEFVPANCTVNASLGYHVDDLWGSLKDARLQFYAVNLFDSRYLGQITTQAQTNVFVAPAYAPGHPGNFTVGTESYSARPGAPMFLGLKLTVNVGH